MKLIRLTAVLLLFESGYTHAAFDPTKVVWEGLKSQVRWFNFYSEPSILTLKIDGFEGLKKVPSGRCYALTLFPFGEFQAEIIDANSRKIIDRFPLKIDNSKIYTVVTIGSASDKVTTLVLEDDPAISRKQFSRVKILNGISNRKLSCLVPNEINPQPAIQILSGKLAEFTFETKKGFHPTLGLLQEGVPPVSLSAQIESDNDSNWVIVIYPDTRDQVTPKVGYYQEGVHPFTDDVKSNVLSE